MAKLIHKETLRHREAFEYFYSLGDKRSLAQVENKFRISEQTAINWSYSFNWKERVEQRDIENAKKLAQKTDMSIVNTKANYRKEIKDSLRIIRAAIGTAILKLKSGELTVYSMADLNQLITAQDKLMKLDLLMMGEATEKEEHKITFEDV